MSNYLGGGSTRTSVIPNASVYGEAQTLAQKAYNDAVAAATAKRSGLRRQAGLTDTGEVDPRNQYGTYQQILRRQGGTLDQIREGAIGRGLGGGTGLGMQPERDARYEGNLESLEFQNYLGGVNNEYQSAIVAAENERQQRMYQALVDSMNYGIQNMEYTPPDMSDYYGFEDESPVAKAKSQLTNYVAKLAPGKARKFIPGVGVVQVPKAPAKPAPKPAPKPAAKTVPKFIAGVGTVMVPAPAKKPAPKKK